MKKEDVKKEDFVKKVQGPEVDVDGNYATKDGLPRTKVDLDTILVEEIGQFRIYQLKSLLLAVVVIIFSSWAHSEYIFTTARISTRCLIPECESLASPAEFQPPWLPLAVPPSGASFDNCRRFGNTSVLDGGGDGTCPAALFDPTTTLSCDHYVYENTNTVVYDYGLACNEWRRSLIGTVRTFGTLTALPITGFVSDRWGRRTALTINAFNTAWIGALRYFAGTYAGFVVSEFAESIFGSGASSSVYILLVELVGPKYRATVMATCNTFFAIGESTMGLLAWGIQDWRTLTLVVYLPQLFTVFYFWLISESNRWYMSKGHYKKLEKSLKEIARVNKKQLSDKSLELLRQATEEEQQKKMKQLKSDEPWLIVLLFRHKEILLRCTACSVWWISRIFIYYGLSVMAVNRSGHKYLNFIAVAAVEIPGIWISFLSINRIGRKPVLISAFWFCGACQILYLFTPTDMEGISLTIYLFGKLSISIVKTTLYVYTVELYPTRYRHRLFAVSNIIGRIGSMLAPLTPAMGQAVWEGLPFVLFGGLALLSGLLVFVTPETLGAKLPDTMEEACSMRKKNDTDSA